MNLDRAIEFLRELEADRGQIDTAIAALRDMIAGIEGVPRVSDAEPETTWKERSAAAGWSSATIVDPSKPKEISTPKRVTKIPVRQANPIKSHGSRKGGNRVIDRTIAVLQKFGEPMSVTRIAASIKHPAKSLQQCLAAYVKRGLLVHTGRAEFGLPEPVAKGNAPAAPKADAEFNPYHHVEEHGRGWLCTRCDEVRADMDEFASFTCTGSV